MYILGINAFHGDASATLIEDGNVVLAIEEERLNRIKHWAGFPYESINSCLREADIGLEDLDHIAISTDPSANLKNKIIYSLSRVTRIHNMLRDRLSKVGNIRDIRKLLSEQFNVRPDDITAEVHNVEHHLAHMASSFFVSPYEEAAILTLDGMGDFVSSKWGTGSGTEITTLKQVEYPHSLGYLYNAVTQYLGFRDYGDEEKVMGLASYGDPVYMDVFREIVTIPDNENEIGFELNLDYFIHHKEGVKMQWKEGLPKVGLLYSDRLSEALGPPRKPEEPYDERYCNIAASLQKRVEEIGLTMMRHLANKTGQDTLCLAGGVALNSVMNGKIRNETPFNKIYIHPNAGDGGTSLGSAYYVWHQQHNNKRHTVLTHPYLGTSFSDEQIAGSLKNAGFPIEKKQDEADLLQRTAQYLADGKVVGWFQGAMEWGPRALGSRSILVDPRRSNMRDVLNNRIKRRENFRPFAPSILEEHLSDYFEQDWPSPVMLMVYKVRKEKQKIIPAVTHVDGTGRLQTVNREHHRRYYDLISNFNNITGVPVLLNTSFNENEPIVHTPEEAIDCFNRTKMDLLVIGNYMIEKDQS